MLLAVLWPVMVDAARQMPRDRPRPATAATGRIDGVVVSTAIEPRPLRRARVTLNGSALTIGRTTITADDGTFVFDAVPPGQYTIGVVKSGYISLGYGASGPAKPGLPVSIAAGGRQTIKVDVPRGSVVTGTVTDLGGEPLPGLQVRALTYRVAPPGGDRRLIEVPGTNVVTDDRGVYRIFGLPRGEYAISVRPRPGAEAFTAGLRTVSGDDVRRALADVRQTRDRRGNVALPVRSSSAAEPEPRVAFASVFYPGATNPSEARLVSLAPGEERRGVDIEVGYVPVARVSGAVVASAGGTAAAYVRLVPDPHDTLVDTAAFRGTTTDVNGGFAFDNLPPGRYTLTARASADGSMQLRYDAASALWASTEVLVDGQDITNIVLSPVPGLTIRGRIVFQGQKPAPRLSDVRMMGLPLWSRTLPGGQPVIAIQSDGEFTLPNVPPGLYAAEFTMGIRTPIGAWWLKSITLDGREALDAPLDLRTSVDGAAVTFADTASELAGRVATSAGEPAANYVVVVFPVERRSWFFNSRRIASTPVDSQGRYTVRNLPPGDYLIAARNDLDALEWFNPGTLESLADTAARIRVREDERLTHDIRIAVR
jgi:hypothetical protein